MNTYTIHITGDCNKLKSSARSRLGKMVTSTDNASLLSSGDMVMS